MPPPAEQSSPGHAANITRLAPSPTGALHLGNARTFLLNWALARRNDWRIVLRIEDLDGPRIKPGSVESIISTLTWLGIDFDTGPLIQSHDLAPYIAAMHQLARRGLIYSSEQTRTEILDAASAPQQGSGEARFAADQRPPRNALDSAGRPVWATGFDQTDAADTTRAWRFASPLGPEGIVEFDDLFAGPQRIAPSETIGDFVVWTKRATPAYQLAVVVDDARQGITRIVRADDLLDSAARQVLLYRALGLDCVPRYCHLPLIVGPDGRRLAKRHGDSRVDTYRDLGVPPEAIIGLAAWLSGLGPLEPIAGSALRARLDLPEHQAASVAQLELGTLAGQPRSAAVFTPELHAWLISQVR